MAITKLMKCDHCADQGREAFIEDLIEACPACGKRSIDHKRHKAIKLAYLENIASTEREVLKAYREISHFFKKKKAPVTFKPPS